MQIADTYLNFLYIKIMVQCKDISRVESNQLIFVQKIRLKISDYF